MKIRRPLAVLVLGSLCAVCLPGGCNAYAEDRLQPHAPRRLRGSIPADDTARRRLEEADAEDEEEEPPPEPMDDDWSKNTFALPQWFSDFSGMVLGAMATVMAQVASIKSKIAQQLAKVESALMETKRNIVESSPLTEDMLEEFVEHVCEGAKDVQKAIMGGPKAMQEAVGVLVKSSAGKLRELCPSIDRGQIQDIITDVVGAALGGDSMPAKAFKKARVKLAKFEEARDKMLGEAMQQMTEVNGLAKEHAQQIMDAVINNVAAVSRAAFGGRKKLMTAAASLMTEVKEEVSSIPGLMKGSPKKKASTTAGGVGDDGDGGGDADGDEEGGGGGMLDTKQLNKIILSIIGAAMGGGKVAVLLKKAYETIEKIGKAMAEALIKNLEGAMEEIKKLIDMTGDQIGQIFAAVKAVVLKNLGNLKSAVMKGASKIQEACKDLLVECQNAMVETTIALGESAPDNETMELITFHIAGAFLGGGSAQAKLVTLHEKAKAMRKEADEACDKRIAEERLKIILAAPDPGISEEAIDGIIYIVRDGGVTGDDKKYSNIWNMQKAAMRGKEALLTSKDETAQKCIKFMATLDDIDHFTEAEKEQIVEQVMIACLGPLGKATSAMGCFKKKTPPPSPAADKAEDEEGKGAEKV